MVQILPYVASFLALGQAVAAAKAVTSFSEWVDGILENPDGDNMTPEEVIDAFKSGQFNSSPSAKFSRSLYQKRATCYESANTDCLITDAVACINTVARKTNCHNDYLQCQINTAALTTDGNRDSSCNDVARGAGFIMDACVVSGVLDIDDLLQPDLQHVLAPGEEQEHTPWSHKPYCMTSSHLATPDQKYCVFTSNTTGPHGLSLIFSPDSAHLATRYFDDNPLDSFLTQEDAERLYLGGQPWKIVDIPGKAKGVVATRKIKMYETFMVDQAAVVVDVEAENALSDVENKKLLKRAVDQLLMPGMIRDMSAAHAGDGDGANRDDEDENAEGSLEEDIMKTNAFGSTVAEVSSKALYPLISRINHACNPNSFVLFSRAGVSMAIKAYHDIEPGEEITVSYLLLGLPSSKRQSLLKRWGFKCTCDLCSLPTQERQSSDLRRTMIAQAEEKIMELAQEYKLAEAIALAEESVDMIEEEGIWSMLTDEYAMLAMLWLEKGDKEKAEVYGKKTHRLLADLGFLGIGEERDAWDLETLLKNIGGLSGMGEMWKKGPLRG
ncbi:hypothetical protein ACET3X_002276 [Alternaria dauci]|uniref:SET domain-containing protein n=1 Tax=Alternaria dauci TaxID=48095 RepID=A0ABR3UR04_9PLEO